MSSEFDFIVVGAGSAGCAAAYGLEKTNVGTIAVLEAGLSNAVPQVKIPFGLAWTRGSKRDWRFLSTPQTALGGREIAVTRGKMLGGSSSINSMVWFRGCRADYDDWNLPGWRWQDVEPDFEHVESLLKPVPFENPHPLSSGFARALGNNSDAPPSPERESAGVFHVNLHNGARWSAADAFLGAAKSSNNVSIFTQANTDRIEFEDNVAKRVVLTDGRVFSARRGILLSGGAIGSPSILMRSGIGPQDHLKDLGIAVQHDSPQVGQNLHDHPAVGLHFAGNNTGYGLALNQFPHWAVAPFNWLFRRKGRFTSNIVESGAFFHSGLADADDSRPDCQSHFIPFMVGHKGSFITWGAGYSADVNVCRPFSRGELKLVSKDPAVNPSVNLGLLVDERDVQTLKAGVVRLREVLEQAHFGERRGIEAYPGAQVTADEELDHFIRERCATAYHPVGTLRMGEGNAPVDPNAAVRGVQNLWVADASLMPSITTANTNAPSMMIGYRASQLIADALKNN